MRIVLALAFLAVVAGCVQPDPITEITIPGHANQVYVFSGDIRESLKVPSDSPGEIVDIGKDLGHVNVVFDGSNSQDNGYFQVVLTNIFAKLPVYYSYEGILLTTDTYYFIGDQWFDAAGDEIEKPGFTDPVIWISGPSTGAAGTSVNLAGNIISVSGTSYDELIRAGDRLVLLLFGIDDINKL